MFKAIIASLVFGSTTTVTMVELYNWNQIGAAEHGSSAEEKVSNSYQESKRHSSDSYFTLSDQSDYIRYLRMSLDNRNKLELVREEKIEGKWQKRPHSVGSKIYYETLNMDGEIIHRGSRPDPRTTLITSSYRGTSVPFILSIPWEEQADEIKVYSVYTKSGRSTKKDLLGSYKLKAM